MAGSSSSRLLLFDDRVARDWQPFTLTRPAGELRFGGATLRARAERVLGLRCAGHVSAPHLQGFDEPDARPVLAAPADRVQVRTVLLCSRAVLLGDVAAPPLPSGPALLEVGGQICGCVVPAGVQPPSAPFLDAPHSHAPDWPVHRIGGYLLEAVWHLITRCAEQTAHDIVAAAGTPSTRLPDGVYRLGREPLLIGAGVELEPGVVLDLRGGPVLFEPGVKVQAFSRVAGPSWVARDSVLLGGSYTAVSVGPVCKVHGEMEECVVLGYANKAHDGFLGHAYLGAWVNLGALTTNSDLKNNYGSIRLWTPAGEVDTGELKIGCLLGDHVKTGIGLMLNTGTVVGAGANLFGAIMPPKYVPPFRWGSGEDLVEYDIDRLVGVARTVMGRRGIELSGSQESLLRQAAEIAGGMVA
ncbi:MAG: putative sugar nucleotidyl transferase [Longimicrobiales bacterium]